MRLRLFDRAYSSIVILAAFLAMGGTVMHDSAHAKAPMEQAGHHVGTTPAVFTAEGAGASFATTINLPNINRPWHMTKVTASGGGAGSLIVQPNGTWKAHFVFTTSGFQSYDVAWKTPSTTLPSTMFSTFGTAPTRFALTFADHPFPGSTPISRYVAIAITDTEGGANATAKALAAATFDVAPAFPTGYLMLTSAGNAQLLPPVAGGIQQTVEAMLQTLTYLAATIEPAGKIEPQQSIVVSITNSAAATLLIWVFYRPTVPLIGGEP